MTSIKPRLLLAAAALLSGCATNEDAIVYHNRNPAPSPLVRWPRPTGEVQVDATIRVIEGRHFDGKMQRFYGVDDMGTSSQEESQDPVFRLSDGAVAWTAPAGTLTAPLLVQGGWVIAASSAKLVALRAADGTAVWTIDAPPPQREAAAISGDTLFVPSTDGVVRARSLETGANVWQHPLRGQPGEPVGNSCSAFSAWKRATLRSPRAIASSASA